MDIISRIRNYLKSHSLRRIWYRVALILSSMAVFVTTYFLMLPALTITGSTAITHLGSIDDSYTSTVSEQGKGVVYNSDGNLKIQVNNIYRIDAYLGPEMWCDGYYDRNGHTKIYDYFTNNKINTILVRLKSSGSVSTGFNGGTLGKFLFPDVTTGGTDSANNNGMSDIAFWDYYLNGKAGTSKKNPDTTRINFYDWVAIKVECYNVSRYASSKNNAAYEFYAVQEIFGLVDKPSKTYDDAKQTEDNYTKDMKSKLGMSNVTDRGFILLVRKDFINDNYDTSRLSRSSGSIYSRVKGNMYVPVAGKSGDNFGWNIYQHGSDDLVDFNQQPLVNYVNTSTGTWNSAASDATKGIYSTPPSNKYQGSNSYYGPEFYGTDQHALGFITFSKAEVQYGVDNIGSQTGDISTVDDIDFKLFNYGWHINMTENNKSHTNTDNITYIRKIAPFFNFRYTDELVYDKEINNYNPHAYWWNNVSACACNIDSTGKCYLTNGNAGNTTGTAANVHRPWPLPGDASYKPFDTDSFEITHSTVEYNLVNGYPVLDLTRNARFANITYTLPSTSKLFANASAYTNNFGKTASNNYGLTQTERSLGYLFGAGDKVVDAYVPKNTILQYDKSAGKYYYDSSKNAVDYDDTTKLFRLRGYVESGHSGSFSGTQTFDFFPFNHCSGIVKGTEFAKDSSGTYTLRQKNYEDCAMLKSMANGEKNLYSQAAEVVRYNNIDYWFGMTMEFNFAQGKNGRLSLRDENGNKLAGDGKQMIFNFSGDDDVWVFIDGVLSLDLGGTHSIVNGSINFSTGEIIQAYPADKDKVYNTTLIESFGRAGALKFNGATKYYNSTTKKFDYSAFVKSGEVPDGWKKVTDGNGVTSYIFDDYSVHNLKFYYLERGGHVANNKIEFYMSTFSNNSLLVEKQVTPANDPDLDVIKETQEYTFRVLYTDENGVLKKDSNGNYISVFEENHPFILRDYAEDGSEINTLSKIAADGTFKLKDKQTAIFENMNDIVTGSGTTVAYYVVQELLPDGQVFQYDGISVNSIPVGANTEDFGTNTGYTSPMVSTADTNHVRFTNKINKEKLHNLEIIKNLEPYKDNYGSSENYGENINADTEFPMEIIFNGDESIPVGAEYYVYNLDSDGNIIADSEIVKKVELISEVVAGVTTNRAVIKIKNGQKAVIKGVLEDTTFVVREIFDAGAGGYTVTYTTKTSNNFDGTCTVGANGVNGQMSSKDSSAATVTITVKNSRKGANVKINVKKIFKNAEKFSGAPNLTFAVYMVQLEQPIPTAKRTDSLSTHLDFSYSVPINDDTKADYAFIYYPDIYEPNETVYYYYRIYESRPEDRPKWLVDYDTSSYIMTVKVEKSADGSELTATIESMRKYATKDSKEYEELSTKDEAVFTNTLKLYSLPTTGANLFLNTRAFSLLGTAMVVSLLVVVLVCVRKRKNGVF